MAGSRDLEFSLSEALIDPDFTEPSNFTHQPYETVQEPMLLFKPPLKKPTQQPTKSNKKTRRISADVSRKKQEGGGGILAEFFGNKKRKASHSTHTKQGTLYRSRSFDTLHRRLKGWDNVLVHDKNKAEKVVNPTTFVYTPHKRADKQESDGEEEPVDHYDDTETNTESETNAVPIRPKRDSQIFKEGISIYEEPISLTRERDSDNKTQEEKVPETQPEPVDDVDQGKPLPPTTSGSPNAPQKPARKRRSSPSLTKKALSFTDQDIMTPPTSSSAGATSSVTDDKKSSIQLPTVSGSGRTTDSVVHNEDMSLLRIRVLGVQLSQKRQVSKPLGELYSDDDDDDDDDGDDAGVSVPPSTSLAEKSPTDGIFCTLTINGKQSSFKSSMQPLKPREQVAVWDHNETEAVFYAAKHQKLFIAGRKLPLKDSKNNQSIDVSQSECFGVGIYPLANLTPEIVTKDNENISNWAEATGTAKEISVDLEPQGNVLLEVSCISLNPNSKVTCNGTVTIKYLNGIDSFREESPCQTCCTVDIDDENYGTTSSIIGMEEFLDKGYPQDAIEFIACNSTACKIQVWGFGDDETEYLFGEAYIPLAAILPYSELIVHQEDEQKPFMLLGEAEQEITLPIEPLGTVGLLFNLSPAPEPDPIELEETIQKLEASGVFTPEAIAHFRQHSGSIDKSSKVDDRRQPLNSITPIPEESPSLESPTGTPSDLSSPTAVVPSESLQSRKPSRKRFIPSRLSLKKKPQDMHISGEYDHLSPSPTATIIPPVNPILHSVTQSLLKDNKKQTLRLLGSIKLQVPTDYHEKKFHMLPDDFDPYREIEIMKVEMRDLKAKLAETQFLREKAELKVKNLETEVENWKAKYSGKKRGRKYH